MKPEEADRIIFKAMHPDKCWHRPMTVYTGATDWEVLKETKCEYCKEIPYPNPSYSSPESFLEMIKWASKQEWWALFMAHQIYAPGYAEIKGIDYDGNIPQDLILDRPRMVALVAEWCLKEKGGGE